MDGLGATAPAIDWAGVLAAAAHLPPGVIPGVPPPPLGAAPPPPGVLPTWPPPPGLPPPTFALPGQLPAGWPTALPGATVPGVAIPGVAAPVPPAPAAAAAAAAPAAGRAPGGGSGSGRTTGSGTRFSGAPLWRFALRKEEQARREDEQASSKKAPIPDGFVRHSDGWYWNPQAKIFWQGDTAKFYLLDSATQAYVEIPPESSVEKELRLMAEASSYHRHETSREDRHVIVKDLAKAAQALKMPVDHLPKPVALYAIYTGHRPAVEGAAAKAEDGAAFECAQFCARNLHLKLLPRLSEFKGPWDDERLRAALRESFEDLDAEFLARPGGAADGCSAVVALLTGRRLFVASTGDAAAVVGEESDDSKLRIVRRTVGHTGRRLVQRPGEAVSEAIPVTRAFGDRAFKASDRPEPLRVVATPDVQLVYLTRKHRVLALGSRDIMALPEESVVATLRRRLGKPRSAAGAVLQAAQNSGSKGSLTSLCVFLEWQTPATEAAAKEPPAKKLKASDAKSALSKAVQVRCRQILVRHKDCKDPLDPVRSKKPVARSLAEAEAILREALDAIETATGQKVFTQKCKAVSECSSCLKGGEMAGDLGWISRGQSHAAVEAAAFALPVGHMSDIVESDEGVHLLWRIA